MMAKLQWLVKGVNSQHALRRENKYLGGKTRYAKRVSKLIKKKQCTMKIVYLLLQKAHNSFKNTNKYSGLSKDFLIKLAMLLFVYLFLLKTPLSSILGFMKFRFNDYIL